jgi:FHS family L-fucose permease-like MFS transporter
VEKAHKALRSLFIITGLLLCMFVACIPFICSRVGKHHFLNAEKNRMVWLLAALAIVVGGLLLIKKTCISKRSRMGSHAISASNIRNAAIFTYVGVEVTIGSNLGELLKQTTLWRI